MEETRSPDAAASPEIPRAPGVRTIGATAPLRWLARGWDDFRATGFRGAFYGALFALMGTLISIVYETRWQLTMGLTAGFFLVGPFVCTGLYELSRQRERGEPLSLAGSLACWRRNLGGIAFFAAILTFAMIVWARVSVVIFALFSTTDFPTVQGMVRQIVDLSNLEFLAVWAGVGFVFATLVFSISVVSIPLMLDRRTDTMIAIFSSVRALFANPLPIYLWAVLIVLCIGASLVLWFGLLIIAAPVIGHATWHAYRDLIE
ncbi:MAG: hypothetical protein RIS35_2035 [Pseudomonadota bacterium]|jgi:uncharacterized membrane protein